MILLFNTAGEHVFSCQHIPDSHKTPEYTAAKLPDSETFDFNRIYTLLDGEIVVGELKPVDTVEIARITAELAATQYQRQRKQAYPQIADQLDTLYHGGYDAWKAEIAAIKAQYPKPAGGNP
jgi:hypothetical protein